jgi:hypothetical protein
MNGGATPK